MNRFSIYEEYGAKYEMMIKDVAAAHRTMPGWSLYQKGLEVLASSLGPAGSHGDQSKKALTINDLLVKVERASLCQIRASELTQVAGPTSLQIPPPLLRAAQAHTCNRLSAFAQGHREHAYQTTRGYRSDQPSDKRLSDKVCHGEDVAPPWATCVSRAGEYGGSEPLFRIALTKSQLDTDFKDRIRSFGNVRVCGALHVCWQTKEGVTGQYMIALLYREWFCLATASQVDQVYTIQACIALVNVKVEDVDNGRGRELALQLSLVDSNSRRRAPMPHGAIFLEDSLLVRQPVV